MRYALWCLLLILSISGLCSAVFRHGHKDNSKPYPELEHVRKIYVAGTHGLGGMNSGPMMRHIRGAIEKSHCVELAGTRRDADAILTPFPHETWLDKIGDSFDNTCTSVGGMATCQGPGGGTATVICRADGCFSRYTPGPGKDFMVIFINPKTYLPMSNWNMKAFWGAKGKIERAVGCPE